MRATPLYLAVFNRYITVLIISFMDYQFYKTGFDSKRIFAAQEDYGKFQCGKSCHNKLYDNEAQIKQMAAEQKDCIIPSCLVPKCSICREDMDLNIRKDMYFIEDNNWNAACERYEQFVQKHKDSTMLFLELGVGGNAPKIKKYPLWRFVINNTYATYTCINYGEAFCPPHIEKHSIFIKEDIRKVIFDLML